MCHLYARAELSWVRCHDALKLTKSATCQKKQNVDLSTQRKSVFSIKALIVHTYYSYCFINNKQIKIVIARISLNQKVAQIVFRCKLVLSQDWQKQIGRRNTKYWKAWSVLIPFFFVFIFTHLVPFWTNFDRCWYTPLFTDAIYSLH